MLGLFRAFFSMLHVYLREKEQLHLQTYISLPSSYLWYIHQLLIKKQILMFIFMPWNLLLFILNKAFIFNFLSKTFKSLCIYIQSPASIFRHKSHSHQWVSMAILPEVRLEDANLMFMCFDKNIFTHFEFFSANSIIFFPPHSTNPIHWIFNSTGDIRSDHLTHVDNVIVETKTLSFYILYARLERWSKWIQCLLKNPIYISSNVKEDRKKKNKYFAATFWNLIKWASQMFVTWTKFSL